MFSKLRTKFKPLSNTIIPKRWTNFQPFYEKNSKVLANIKLFPASTYGGSNIVTLIHCANKASMESSGYIKEILQRVNAPIIFEEINPHEIVCDDNESVDDEYKLNKMDELILSFQRNRNALMTDYTRLDTIQQYERIRMSGTLRLFVAVMKFFPFPGFNTRDVDYDITLMGGNIMPDNTGLEYEPIKGMVETLRICTQGSMQRFIYYVFDYAIKHKRREITFVHNLEHFAISDGIFLDLAREIHKKYPSIHVEPMTANEIAIQIVINPRRFDIICCNERYTNAIASIIGGVCGGVDLFCSCSFGTHHALFQSLENRISLPLDNDSKEMSPYSVISACVQLLLHLGYCEIATAVWEALIKTMIKDEIKTKKYCGRNTPADVYCKVIDYLKSVKITNE